MLENKILSLANDKDQYSIATMCLWDLYKMGVSNKKYTFSCFERKQLLMVSGKCMASLY